MRILVVKGLTSSTDECGEGWGGGAGVGRN